MRLDQAARDVKAQPEAAVLVCAHLSEALEDRFERLLRNARPRIAHRQPHATVVALADERDLAAARRVLEGVRDQVAQYLEDAVVIEGRVERCVVAATRVVAEADDVQTVWPASRLTVWQTGGDGASKTLALHRRIYAAGHRAETSRPRAQRRDDPSALPEHARENALRCL